MPADPSAAAEPVTVREVAIEVVRPLRHLVLRPGRPLGDVHTPRDEDPATWHLAALVGDRPVGVMTLFEDPPPFAPLAPAERFRWMAVHPDWRGRGVGRMLLRAAAARLDSRGVRLMWAHGRDSAQPFYERYGFQVRGSGFTDPDTGIGHHFIAAEVGTVIERTAPG